MFSKKTIQPLIFDEFPYKKYMVKCAQPPQLKFLPFDSYEFRVYKGEGTVQLVAYYPFAFSVISPSLVQTEEGAVINNIGDLPANLSIIYDLTQLSGDISLELREEPNSADIGQLNLKNIERVSGDIYMLINTQTQLIEGLNAQKEKTGNLYNKYIDSGDFFWPPVGRTYLLSSQPFESAQYTPMYY